MSEALHLFHFLRPAWFWLLLALPLLAWLALRGQGARAQLERLVDPALLPHLLHGRAQRRGVPPALLACGWLLAVLALAGPSWSRVPQPLFADRAAQVVAISLSQRMLARDVAPSRLDRARYKARDLLAANHGGLNGLIAYAGEAFVVAPLTSDAHSLDDLLEALSPDTMPVEGDNAAAAIARGAALIRDAGTGGGSLVLVTDDAGARAQQAARQARAGGVRVSVLGVGTSKGAPVPLAEGGFLRDAQGAVAMAGRDDAALAALAAAGGGRYVAMRADRADIQALQAELRVGGNDVATGQASAQWEDRGPWLLLPLLPLLALAFRRGWVLLLPLVLLPMLPARAEAGTWHDLWQRRDQQAAQALHAGHPKQALALARDPALRGAAAYRAGDYDKAIDALQPIDTTGAQYNLGNALSKAGRYQDALAAYDRALALDPRNADAKANRQAVADWLRRQPPQQPSPQDPQNQNGGKSSPSKQGNGDPQSKKDSQGNRRGEQQDGKQDNQGQQGQGRQQPDAQGDRDGHGQQREQQGANRPLTAQERAEQQARMARAGEALEQQMDRALADKAKTKGNEHQLGALDKGDPQARLPAELRQALQRVPDDPGALLRRKFELEYRQRHGGPSVQDLP
ncbi:VWA domain-containing protein [Frateuria hangzhouensis]|uniref:VWA domain-containing protein n=1 Tax=Frateuria hangzhouensis TaxID=2995589 RepID=UPI002260A416|nr:VWA domain-containing protein [Frateuria sp. STR12]MCX7515072.1 VWA domain-containing protein [Frateuria sp. STR12]